jgi:hypothetical protein
MPKIWAYSLIPDLTNIKWLILSYVASNAVSNLLRFRETAVEARDAIEYGHGAWIQTVPATMKDPDNALAKGLFGKPSTAQISPASIVSTCLFRAEPLRSSCSTDNGVPVARGQAP